jgi:hypothetical protein
MPLRRRSRARGDRRACPKWFHVERAEEDPITDEAWQQNQRTAQGLGLEASA